MIKKNVSDNNSNNMPYYWAAVGIFLLLKYTFTFVGNNGLAFLLWPTDKMVSLLTGSSSVYHSDSGYYHEALAIVIDKSCSGYNYWLLSFVVFSYVTVRYFRQAFYKILALPLALILAYLFTIFVNTSRIFTSIAIQLQSAHFLPAYSYTRLHEVIGIVTNLSFLVGAYYLFEKLLKPK